MKRAIIVILLCLPLFFSCEKPAEKSLFCTVSMPVTLPDGRSFVSMTIDPSLPGNIFKNLNTAINYTYPVFINGYGSLQVQKGVYQISFDGELLFEDGTTARGRCSTWGTPEKAINLVEDEITLPIELVLL